MSDWSLAPGAVIGGRYRVDAPLGEGGFGAVFVATQLNLGRQVALKILHPELGADSTMLARFDREAELVRRLEHPHTVRLLDFGRAPDGAPYLVFELLRGRTLAEVMVSDGALPAARVAKVASQILKALMEAHALGIVHRDIKPPNVFLSDFMGEADFVKVLDFGIARGSSLRALTQRGALIGTPAYMAPEQFGSGDPTFASDLYALGLCMSEALSGEGLFRRFPPTDVARLQLSPAPVPHPPAVLASPLGRVIARATEKAPQQRYPSAAAMLADLEAAMTGVALTLMAPPAAIAVTPQIPETFARSSVPVSGPATFPQSPALPFPGKVTYPQAPVMAASGPVTFAQSPATALPNQATLLAPPPGALPIQAVPPPRRPAPSRAPLVAAIVGAGLLLAAAAALLVTLVSSPRKSASGGGGGVEVPEIVKPKKDLPHVRLTQLTKEMMIERAQDAGYEVVSNQSSDLKSIKMQTISVRKDSRNGMAMLYHYDDARAARMSFDAFQRQDSNAASMDGTVVLLVQMANGAERGNRASAELLRALVR